MFQRTLPILLAVVIATCPLTCQVTAPVSHDGVSGSAQTVDACDDGCDRCTETGSPGDRHDSPLPGCPCRDNCQNCICSGALIDNGDGYQIDLLPSFDLPADLSSSALSATGARGDLSRVDGRPFVISGRDVRALISSFLC